MSKEKKQDKAVKQVYETADLSKFKQLKGNRPIKISKALRDSIAKRGVLTEIKVNRKMEVIDGQHRLAVARELGLPITYTFDDSDIDVAELNSTSKSWKVEDYIHKYAESGYQSYKQLLNLMTTYPSLRMSSTISTALGYSSTAGRKTDVVRDGAFRFRNYKEYVKFAQSYQKFIDSTDFRSNTQLQGVYFLLYTLDSFNAERFTKKVIAHDLASKLVGVTSFPRLFRAFLDVNNNRLKPKSPYWISVVTNELGEAVISGKFNNKLLEAMPKIKLKD